MKRFILLLFIPALLVSCGGSEAEAAATEYHEKFDAGEFDYICDNLIYPEDLELDGRENWMMTLNTLASWGEHKNRTQQSAFSSKVTNGVYTYKLKYTFECDRGLVYESLVFVDRGEGYKLLSAAYDSEEAQVDETHKNF